MAKGTVYDSERAIQRDPRTGLRIFRLTHSPCIATNLYFEMCSFSRDERYVIFLCQRSAGRDAPWDLFRARTDGLELVQLTDAEDIHGIVVSPEADKAFYMTSGVLKQIDLHTLEERDIAKAPGDRAVSPRSLAAIDGRGAFYFANCFNEAESALLFKVEVASGKVEILHESERQNHITVDAGATVVAFNDWQEGTAIPSLLDANGKNLRPQAFARFAHNTWFGQTATIQGTLVPPGHAIATFAEGDVKPTILTEGRYYWHSSSSRDGQWIVSDTNWPQEGLYLFHVPSRTVTYVCDPQSSCSHPQWTHPHPSLSPNLKYVLYNSDATGIGQVYLAELTPEFTSQAAQGYVCRLNLVG